MAGTHRHLVGVRIMIQKIPTHRSLMARVVEIVETPAFVWALYTAIVVGVVLANLESFQ